MVLRSAAENRSFADRLPGPMWVWLPSSAFQAPPPLPPRWLLLELACRLALEVRHQFGDVFRLLDHLLERRAPAFGERSGQQVRAVEAEDLRTGYLLRLRACEDVRVGARRDALVRREDPGGGQDRPRFRRAQVEEQLSHRFVVDEDGDHGAATDERAGLGCAAATQLSEYEPRGKRVFPYESVSLVAGTCAPTEIACEALGSRSMVGAGLASGRRRASLFPVRESRRSGSP